jgi:hypothetical protein
LLLASIGVARAEFANGGSPTLAQLTAIASWVSANSDLPPTDVLPRVEFVPQGQLQRLRYGPILRGQRQTDAGNGPQGIGSERTTALPQSGREVVAVYRDDTETIYLPETWTGASMAEQSVLVHEMAHHLQNRARLTYACVGAREKLAYLLQKEWLERHGLDFEEEVQVDMFTVLILSAC